MTQGRIPNRFQESIDRFVESACPTGGFLRAVLENDLKGACGRADLDARAHLFEIVRYCYNEIPMACWGSVEKVAAWRGLEEFTKEKGRPR